MAYVDYNNKDDYRKVGSFVGFVILICWAAGYWSFYFWCNFFFKISSKGGFELGNHLDEVLDHGFLFLGIAAVVVIYGLAKSSHQEEQTVLKEEEQKEGELLNTAVAHLAVKTYPGFNGLALGISTGMLADRSHYGGLSRGTNVFLKPADVCKNIWIGGGVGGGKTTRFINPILHQICAQDCSALIFDIKGDFRREVDYIAKRLGRSYRVIGDGGLTLNLFRGCTPEVAASYLKSCFIASGSASGDGSFWAETATNYCRNIMMLIRLCHGDYSIAGLADLVFSESKRMEALKAAREREQAGEMDAREQRVWNAVLGYFVEAVAKWDDKFRGNVQATCEAVLNPFVSPDMVDAFSIESQQGEADLYDLLNKQEMFLINLPRHKFGANGARFAYLLIKLRFFTMMTERRARPELNQDRYCAFLCDEYQTIVDSVSDVDFWDKSRSSKCFGVLSMQGYSSLVQAVGNPNAAAAIMQNWRQRAIFRTEDAASIELFQKLLGQIDVHATSVSHGESVTESFSGAGGSSVSISESAGQSTGIQQQHLFNANDFRKLDARFALFIGNIGDKAADDVLDIQPLFVPE